MLCTGGQQRWLDLNMSWIGQVYSPYTKWPIDTEAFCHGSICDSYCMPSPASSHWHPHSARSRPLLHLHVHTASACDTVASPPHSYPETEVCHEQSGTTGDCRAAVSIEASGLNS